MNFSCHESGEQSNSTRVAVAVRLVREAVAVAVDEVVNVIWPQGAAFDIGPYERVP